MTSIGGTKRDILDSNPESPKVLNREPLDQVRNNIYEALEFQRCPLPWLVRLVLILRFPAAEASTTRKLKP